MVTNTVDHHGVHQPVLLLEQRLRHLAGHADDQAGGGRRHAGEHALQRLDGAEDRIEERKEDHDHHARTDQSDQRHRSAGQAADAAAEHHREIDDRGPGQDLAQRDRRR